MMTYICYASADRASVIPLASDVEALGHQLYFDHELVGGQQWWSTILQQIRNSELFMFVLSPDSIRSQVCQAQLIYAQALRRPILLIMVRTVNPDAISPTLASQEVVDYTNRTSETALGLAKALNETSRGSPLPEPSPPEPARPTSDLAAYQQQLDAPELAFTAQRELYAQLRSRLEDPDSRDTVARLLHQLRNRPDLAHALVDDLDDLLKRKLVGQLCLLQPSHAMLTRDRPAE